MWSSVYRDRLTPTGPQMDTVCDQRFSRTFTLKNGRRVAVRSAVEENLEDMSRIAHEAFSAAGVLLPPREEHDFFKGFFSMCLDSGSPTLVACDGNSGACLGSVTCVTGGKNCSGLGPVTVDTAHQKGGIGRVLMTAIMDHVKDARGEPAVTFRLTLDPANTAAFCLYASLGFKACGNLLEFNGLPPQHSDHATGSNLQEESVAVRIATLDDVAACSVLFQGAHAGNMECTNDIRNAVTRGKGVYGWHVYVMTDSKDGSIVAYTTGMHVHGHTVARNEATFKLFLEMLSTEVDDIEKEVCSIVVDPVRYPDVVQWMLATKMRLEKQHTMMTTGCYTGPVAPFVYCPTLDY